MGEAVTVSNSYRVIFTFEIVILGPGDLQLEFCCHPLEIIQGVICLSLKKFQSSQQTYCWTNFKISQQTNLSKTLYVNICVD